MGKKSRKKPPPAAVHTCGHCSKNIPADVVRRCGKCDVAKYCDRECQVAGWSQHKGMCKQMKRDAASARLAKAKQQTGFQSVGWATGAGSMKAVKALVAAGADVEETDDTGATALYCAAQLGRTEFFKYLVEECGAVVSVRVTRRRLRGL